MIDTLERYDISVFEIFKVGIGPSSSHTMGPWRAALDFIEQLRERNLLIKVKNIQIELLGSLCKTGKGHGTDMGIMMGLCGELPDMIDPQKIPTQLDIIKTEKRLAIPLNSSASENQEHKFRTIEFDLKRDIIFVWNFKKSNYLTGKLKHPNTLFFAAQLQEREVFCVGYHSVGGGFIEKIDGDTFSSQNNKKFPYPVSTVSDITQYHSQKKIDLDQIVLANERAWKTDEEIDDFLETIKTTMISSIYRGCHTEGVLAGGLNVNRRAPGVYRSIVDLLPDEIKVKEPPYDPQAEKKSIIAWIDFIKNAGLFNFKQTIDWVICFALAVNEENASFGRIVTAPTNGAAGVIPAVLLYYICFHERPVGFVDVKKFLFCAGEIGSLFKKGSTISAAAGGCQAEIGVSSSMASAALTAVEGGSFEQILMAAEIAMEHHLGLTCDPIEGLVQVPCIERNTMGAIKAITASQLALVSDPNKTIVQLQDVITAMWNTAKDMSSKYKETSEGGLATSVSVNYTEC